MQPTVNAAMWAVRDALLAPGRFPVFIYAPSFSAMAWENVDLREYLASYGEVVIATPDLGVTNRKMTNGLKGIQSASF